MTPESEMKLSTPTVRMTGSESRFVAGMVFPLSSPVQAGNKRNITAAHVATVMFKHILNILIRCWIAIKWVGRII